jgi:hypothetical protein
VAQHGTAVTPIHCRIKLPTILRLCRSFSLAPPLGDNWEIHTSCNQFRNQFLQELFQFLAISEAKTIRQASLEPATSVELELGNSAQFLGSALNRGRK